MFAKLCFIHLLIISVSSGEKHLNDTIKMKVNDKEIQGQIKCSNDKIYLKRSTYNFTDEVNLKFTCEAVNIPGQYHHLVWIHGSEKLKEQCVDTSFTFNSSLYLPVETKTNMTLQCQVTSGDENKCDFKKSKKYVIVLKLEKKLSPDVTDKIIFKSNENDLEVPPEHYEDVNIHKGETGQNTKDLKNAPDRESRNDGIIKSINTTNKDMRKITNSFIDAEVASAKKNEGKALIITGLEEKNILNKTDDYIEYRTFNDEMVYLICSLKNNKGIHSPKMIMEWFIDGKSTKKGSNNEISLDFKPNHADTTIICSATEDTPESGKIHAEKMIKIVNLPIPVAVLSEGETREITEKSVRYDDTEKSDSKSLILYIVIAIISTILLLVLIVLIVTNCKKAKVKENNTIVHWNSAIKTCEIITTDDTYSNPADSTYYTGVNNVSTNYSVPYRGILYATPIPKNLRVVKHYVNNDCCLIESKMDYENLKDKKKVMNINDKIPYENLKQSLEKSYVNLDCNNSDTYSNTFNGSDLYCYTVVRK